MPSWKKLIISGSDASLNSLHVATSITSSIIQLTGGTGTQGAISWNSDEETLDLIQNDAVLQLGQELQVHCRNNTVSQIDNGTVVMATGTIGASGRITIAPANPSLGVKYILGIATEDIAADSDGKVTVFGKVRGIDTSMWPSGSVLYASASGTLTDIEPTEHPRMPMAYVINNHSEQGTLMVRVTPIDELSVAHGEEIYQAAADTKNPTGWVDGDNIAVSYSYTDKKITLTHASNLYYYWRGSKKELGSSGTWTSSAHTGTVGNWYLYSNDGANFSWSDSAWDFDDVMVSFVRYGSSVSASYALREVHGNMDWEVHRQLHLIYGTYRYSGGAPTAGTYNVNSAVDADTTPGFDEAIIRDEDCQTTIPAWTQGTYTTMWVSASNTSVFSTTESFPFLSAGSYMQVNNATAGTMADGIGNKYYNIYQILIPVGADADSQKYRTVILQPQNTYTTLAAAQAEDARSLNFGSLTTLTPEFTIYTRITYVTSAADGNTGKCRIATGGISYVTGTMANSISVSGFTPTAAENVTFLPSGSISATNVQSALEELDSEKVDYTGTPAANQIAVFTDPNTISGSGNLTFNGSTLAVTGNVYTYGNSSLGTNAYLYMTSTRSGSIIFRVPTTDNSFNGLVYYSTSNKAGETISAGNLIVLSGSNWYNADHNFSGLSTNILGVAMLDSVTNGIVYPISHGHFTTSSYNFTRDSLLYVGVSGSIQTSPPSGSGQISRVIGNAYSSSICFINPENDWTVVNVASNLTGSFSGSFTGDLILGENNSMELDPSLSADGKYSGITIVGTGGDTIAFGDLVTLDKDDSRWEKVDISVEAAATGDARGLLGMAVSSSTDGNPIKVLLMGNVRADANFPTLTIGAQVWASTTGDITSTRPTTTDYVQRVIGFALTADSIFFNPSADWQTQT